MNGVLLIPCVGPMQSWGTRSRFQERDTEREPSKSGMIGLLCAALGRDRESPIDDLAILRMGVRIDREGKLDVDFQTAQNVAVASGGSPQDLLSNRHYLSDAAFLVALEGNYSTLAMLHQALAHPTWMLFLGRKSYVPSKPPYLPKGLLADVTIEEALLSWPLMISPEDFEHRLKVGKAGRDNRIRLALESKEQTHEIRNDQPVCFALGRRVFHQRYITTEYADINKFTAKKEESDVSDTVEPQPA